MLGLFALRAYQFAGYTVDDAYISFRYATNWASGHGPVFNPGERVEGYTNFLWVALLALAHRAGSDPLVTAKVSGLALSAASLIVTCFAARRATGCWWTGWLATTLTATLGMFMVNAVDGLETPLVMFTATLAVVSFAYESAPWSMIPAMACYLARPDGLLLPAGLMAVALWRRDRAWLARAAALCAVVLAAHVAWRWSFYGDLVPNTFHAKRGGTLALAEIGVVRSLDFARASGGLIGWTCAALMVFHAAWRPLAVASFSFIAGRLLFMVYSGGSVMGDHRFLAPVLPLGGLLAAAAIAELLGPARLRAGALALGALIGLTNLWAGRELRAHRLMYAHSLERAHVALARDLVQESRPGDSLACGDVGALPYFSGLPTIDLLGLTDAHIARLPGPFKLKLDPDYVFDRRPTWIVLEAAEPQPFHGLTPQARAVHASPRLAAGYAFWRQYRFDDRYWLWVYRAKSLPPGS